MVSKTSCFFFFNLSKIITIKTLANIVVLPIESHGFTFDGGLCYYISTELKNWQESRRYCTDKQSDLIVMNSKEKQVLYCFVHACAQYISAC